MKKQKKEKTDLESVIEGAPTLEEVTGDIV